MKPFFYKTMAIFMLSMTVLSPAALANDSSAVTDKGFSVRIKDTKAQMEEKLPYFHYQVKENGTYTNVYILENRTKTAKTIDVKPVNAFTNPFASFNFSTNDKTDLSVFNDPKRMFTSFVKSPETVSLAPSEKKEVSVTVTIPEGVTDGELVGGMIFEEQNQEKDTPQTNSTILKSKVNFIISTLMEFEQEEKVLIEFGDVKFNSNYAVPRLEAEVINKNGSFLKESVMNYVVKKKNGNVIFEGKTNINRFAPSTNVWVPIQWEFESIKEGDYLVDLTFTSKKNEFEPVSSTENLKITKEMLQQHQVEFGKDKIVPVVDLGKFQTYVLLLLVALASAGLAVYWMKRKEKKLEEKYRIPAESESADSELNAETTTEDESSSTEEDSSSETKEEEIESTSTDETVSDNEPNEVVPETEQPMQPKPANPPGKKTPSKNKRKNRNKKNRK